MVFYNRLMVSLAVVKSLLRTTRRIIRRNWLWATHFGPVNIYRSRDFRCEILFLRHAARRSSDTAAKTVAHRSQLRLMIIELARERKSYRRFRSERKIRGREEKEGCSKWRGLLERILLPMTLICSSTGLHGKKMSPDTVLERRVRPRTHHVGAIFFGDS